jgi:hypothetical protein
MSVIPATQEVQVGELRSEASLGKVIVRLYLKNKLKAKRVGVRHKW